MDIKPHRPKKPLAKVSPVTAPKPIDAPVTVPIETPSVEPKTKMKKSKKIVLFSIVGFFVFLLALFAAAFIWYNVQLSPVNSKDGQLIKVTIEPNTTPKAIANQLKMEGLIRSPEAFSIYARLSKTQNNLQAGSYRLSPSESVPDIITHLTKGTVDTFNITFYPGATLAENKEVLIKEGYTEAEVTSALSATYDNALFATKPASSDLEGYIYGETYNFSTGATVGDILNRTFNQYMQVITENDLISKFNTHGLTLYQGITLASIIQREATKGDEPQIAQVFYSRLAMNMELGSDVTYQYIADKTGVDRDPNLDSPYNTRRYTGLPPGPISVPGIRSLLAVADPAPGDYLFFLSGDDDVTYYARTLSEHEANISAHCKVKCSTL